MPRFNIEISKEAKYKFGIILACKKDIYKKGANLARYLLESAINNSYKKIIKKGIE